MKAPDSLRAFAAELERCGQLRRIQESVSPHLEMTALCDRVLRRGGPALLFERPQGYTIPVLANLFGSSERIARALGLEHVSELRRLGQWLADLKEPRIPENWGEVAGLGRTARALWHMRPATVRDAPCQEEVLEGAAVDLEALPLQHCWPGDAAPLLTWGVVITRGPLQRRQNLGIYRQQRLARHQLIIRWLAHRGGAQDFLAHTRLHPGQPFPMAVAIGADPATLLAAVMPVPDALSEYHVAGLLRGARTEVVPALSVPLEVPAQAEIVLEGHIYPDPDHPSGWQHAPEGPFGDHTGYYNEVAEFPVLTVDRITRRRAPWYHSTYTGKPPDEPGVLGMALNELFIPLLQRQFPEIVDFYLPPQACSYRLAVVSIRKGYPGHARRIMMGIWGCLQQFSYTKFIIVVDDDIDIRDWGDVVWALTTRCDPVRDCVLIERTPIDYLDFASPVSGLGGKMGLDATHKWPGETSREWGRSIAMDTAVQARMDALASKLGL